MSEKKERKKKPIMTDWNNPEAEQTTVIAEYKPQKKKRSED